MKTGSLFYFRRQRWLFLVPLVGLFLGWPAPLLADALLGIGILGGALVGSLLGSANHRGQNAWWGGVAGGATTHVAKSIGEPRPTNSPLSAMGLGTTTTTDPVPMECRSMQTQGFVNGRQENLLGTACRAKDSNTWQFRGTPRVVPQSSAGSGVSAVMTDPPPQMVSVYPSSTLVVEPLPTVVTPPAPVAPPYGGRYYGDRDYWRDRYHRTVDW